MLTVIGEALVDVVHKQGEQTHAYPGGSPMNVAVGVSRLGHPTQFVGHYGADDYGRAISEHLEASGVNVPFAPTAARTSTAQAHIGQDGAAEYEFNIDWSLDALANELVELARTSQALIPPIRGPMKSNGAEMWAEPSGQMPLQVWMSLTMRATNAAAANGDRRTRSERRISMRRMLIIAVLSPGPSCIRVQAGCLRGRHGVPAPPVP